LASKIPWDEPLETVLDGLRFLVVDDDPDTLEVTASLLRLCGATVRTASCASEALALLGVWGPDALLSDLEMPGEDGCQLIARVRQLPGALGHLPAIAITAHHQTMDRIQASAAGFTSLVPKPFNVVALVGMLRRLRGRDRLS
jgi:CheY-like chemotaxis protein